jgi:hypothetical protein
VLVDEQDRVRGVEHEPVARGRRQPEGGANEGTQGLPVRRHDECAAVGETRRGEGVRERCDDTGPQGVLALTLVLAPVQRIAPERLGRGAPTPQVVAAGEALPRAATDLREASVEGEGHTGALRDGFAQRTCARERRGAHGGRGERGQPRCSAACLLATDLGQLDVEVAISDVAGVDAAVAHEPDSGTAAGAAPRCGRRVEVR